MFDWFEWDEDRWIIYIVLIVVGIILLDETAYTRWKILNPGSSWSHLRGVTAPLVDPNAPPTTVY